MAEHLFLIVLLTECIVRAELYQRKEKEKPLKKLLSTSKLMTSINTQLHGNQFLREKYIKFLRNPFLLYFHIILENLLLFERNEL